MSVVKGKRDTSPTEYVYQSRELRKYTIQKCVGFPKRYTFYVSQPIADLSNEVYNHAIKANSIFPKKTHIVKLTHGFTWLKCRWYLTSTGKVVKKIYKRSVTKQRQKLKKFVTLVKNGTMTPEDVFTAFQSWRAYARHFDAWHTIRNMEKLYTQLFGVPA